MRRSILNVIANILGIVGFMLSVFIACRIFPNDENTGFDYQAVLVGIMGAIFTLLVGWNIYQTIDLSKALSKVEDLKEEMDGELKRIQNKTDYNQAVTNGSISQAISFSFAPEDAKMRKCQMLVKGIAALKTFSRMEDCQDEIDKTVNAIHVGMINTENVYLPERAISELIARCGEIQNRNKIGNFTKIIRLLEACREVKDK